MAATSPPRPSAGLARLAAVPASDKGRRLFVALLLLLAVLRGWNLATVELPFNGWDEVGHLAVAAHVYEHDHMPAADDTLPSLLVPFFEAHPHPAQSRSILLGLATEPYRGTIPRCCGEPAVQAPFRQYQAQQTPLYYHLMARLLRDTSPAGLLAWADLGRLLGLGLLLGTIGLWYALLRRLVPVGPLAWLPEATMLLFVSFSYVPYNFIRFANDGLALFLGSLALWVACRWLGPGQGPGRGRSAGWGLVGVLTGLAVLAKATALVLLPVFGATLLWRLARGNKRSLAALSLVAFAVGYAAVAGAYHLPYLLANGQPTGMQEAIINASRGLGLQQLLAAIPHLTYGFFDNPVFYFGWAHRGGWSDLTSSGLVDELFKGLILASLLAWCVCLSLRSRRAPAWRFLRANAMLPGLVVCTTAGLYYHALQSLLAWGASTTSPWYAMLSLPAGLALLCLGPGLLGRWPAAIFVGLAALDCNAAYLHGTYRTLLAQETGLTDLAAGIRSVTAHHALFRLPVDGGIVAEGLCLGLLLLLTLTRMLAVNRESPVR